MFLRSVLPRIFFICLLYQTPVYAENLATLPLSTSITQEISTILNTKQNSLLARSNFEFRADDVETLYKTNNYAPIWLNTPQAEKNITDVLTLLSTAALQGLNPDDYSVNLLKQNLSTIQFTKSDSMTDFALYDTALSVSLVRFLHDVHYGRVNPRSLNFNVKLRTKKSIDLPQIIQTAMNEGNVLQLAFKVEPNLQQYRQLRTALSNNNSVVSTEEKPHKKAKKSGNHSSEYTTKIQLAMERLRWLPEMNAGQSIIVNIPAFKLWAIDSTEQTNSPVLNLNVVVGKSEKTPTPVLMAEMRYVEFMPYWNVPPSILKKEIMPKLAHNPGYLARQNMEVVSLKNGGMRVRQRPGGKNALGRIKFVFPNSEGVYLHDTPSKSLFARTRRDFSHGCVRVQNPSLLAQFVLKNQEGWTQGRIDETLRNSTHHQVSLKTHIPVLFFYSTAFYEQGDKLTFYSDIYGHDATLLAALGKANDVSDSAFIAREPEIIEPSHTPTPEPDDSQLFSEPSPTHEPLIP